MKTRTPGLLGANWQGGRGAGTASRTAEAPRGSSCGGNNSYCTLGYLLCSHSRAEYSLPAGQPSHGS